MVFLVTPPTTLLNTDGSPLPAIPGAPGTGGGGSGNNPGTGTNPTPSSSLPGTGVLPTSSGNGGTASPGSESGSVGLPNNQVAIVVGSIVGALVGLLLIGLICYAWGYQSEKDEIEDDEERFFPADGYKGEKEYTTTTSTTTYSAMTPAGDSQPGVYNATPATRLVNAGSPIITPTAGVIQLPVGDKEAVSVVTHSYTPMMNDEIELQEGDEIVLT